MNILLLTVPLAPLMAALLILIFGRRLAVNGGNFTIAGIAVALVALLMLSGSEPSLRGIWLETAGFKLSIGLQLDSLSQFMALLVAVVALLVSIYATGYMVDEEGRSRFF